MNSNKCSMTMWQVFDSTSFIQNQNRHIESILLTTSNQEVILLHDKLNLHTFQTHNIHNITQIHNNVLWDLIIFYSLFPTSKLNVGNILHNIVSPT